VTTGYSRYLYAQTRVTRTQVIPATRQRPWHCTEC